MAAFAEDYSAADYSAEEGCSMGGCAADFAAAFIGAAGSDTARDGTGYSGGAPVAPPTPDPQVMSAQACLAQVVDPSVPQDGLMGPQTRQALRTFQAQQQLPVTGYWTRIPQALSQAACSPPPSPQDQGQQPPPSQGGGPPSPGGQGGQGGPGGHSHQHEAESFEGEEGEFPFERRIFRPEFRREGFGVERFRPGTFSRRHFPG